MNVVFFAVRTPIYVGQTTETVELRTRRHVDQAYSESGKEFEPKILEALKKTERWWQKWVMIPLEVIPFPEGLTPGTKTFLEAFRSIATVREQWWIRNLDTRFPHGLNLEVHVGNPRTKERRDTRQQWQEVPSKSRQKQPREVPQKETYFSLDENGLKVSRNKGHASKIRNLLADFLDLETEEEQQSFLGKLPRFEHNRMLNWLALNMPRDGTGKRLFEQTAVQISEAQKIAGHASQHIFRSYDATSSEQQSLRREKRDKAAGNFWIKVPWRRDEMQFLGLHSLLNNSDIQKLYPISTENERVKVSYNLSLPIGVLLQNYGTISQDPEVLAHEPPEVPPPERCSCQKYRSDGSIDFKQHVATADPAFIHNERLRSYWLKGRKFRCQTHPQHVMESFACSLDNFITSAAKRNKVDDGVFQPWRQKLLDVLKAKCEVTFARENAPFHTFLCKEGFDELHRIHKEMVVTYADKSSHDFVLCCKQVYKRLLWEEIHSGHYLTKVPKNEDIWASHKSYSDMVGRPAVDAHRYLYGILKMHKNPVGVHWIAGNHMQDLGDRGKKSRHVHFQHQR